MYIYLCALPVSNNGGKLGDDWDENGLCEWICMCTREQEGLSWENEAPLNALECAISTTYEIKSHQWASTHKHTVENHFVNILS